MVEEVMIAQSKVDEIIAELENAKLLIELHESISKNSKNTISNLVNENIELLSKCQLLTDRLNKIFAAPEKEEAPGADSLPV